MASSQQKAKETTQKYLDLIKESKAYEFSQKILSLGHRKNATGNFNDAIYLYLESAKELVQVSEINIAINLLQNAFEILSNHKELAEESLKSEFLSIYSLLPKGQDKLKYANRLLNEFYFGDAEICRVVAIDLLNNELFHLAQIYIINLSDADFSINFLHKWLPAATSEVEAEFYVARYILAKIAGKKQDEAEQILNAFKKDTPLFNFLGYLLRACRIKSRKAYSKLASKYLDILKVDPDIVKVVQQH